MPYGVDFCKFGPKALAYGPPIIPLAAPFVNSKNVQKIIKNFYKICTICLLTRKVNSNYNAICFSCQEKNGKMNKYS